MITYFLKSGKRHAPGKMGYDLMKCYHLYYVILIGSKPQSPPILKEKGLHKTWIPGSGDYGVSPPATQLLVDSRN